MALAWSPSHSRSSSGSSFASNSSSVNDNNCPTTKRPSAAYISHSQSSSPASSPLATHFKYTKSTPHSHYASSSASISEYEDKFEYKSHKELLKMSAAALSDRRGSTFLGGLFGPAAADNSRRSSLAPPAQGGKKFSSFFGLGAAANASSTSSLAFGGGGNTNSRSCSGCTTKSNMRSSSYHAASQQTKHDEYAGLDFSLLLSAPETAMGVTPEAMAELQAAALKIIDNLYNSYLDRTRSLNETLDEVEVLREESGEKNIKIEALRSQVENLANAQQTMSKGIEDTKVALDEAKEKAREANAERNRLSWASKSIRTVSIAPMQYGEESEDDTSLTSEQRFSRGSVVASNVSRFSLPLQQQQQKRHSHSDSGFESGSDSGSLFAPDYSPSKPAQTLLPSSLLAFTPPASPTREQERESSIATTITGAWGKKKGVSRMKSLSEPSWEVVKTLREENGSLKGRVTELEECLEACLEVVSGNF